MNSSIEKEIRTFFKKANLQLEDIEIVHDKEISLDIITLNTSDAKLFFEDDREVYTAFQYLMKKIMDKKDKTSSFNYLFDIDGSQLKIIQEAKQKASIAYTRVIQFEKPYEFGFLNAFERMVIHSYLKNYKDVKTVSEGEGLQRRLQVIPVLN